MVGRSPTLWTGAIRLSECTRVLAPQGLLLLSVISLWGSARGALLGALSLPPETNRLITDSGNLTGERLDRGGHYHHMFRAGELRVWLKEAGLAVVALSACNALSVGWDDELSEVGADPAKWAALLRMELEACAEPESLNMGTHIIAVARLG